MAKQLTRGESISEDKKAAIKAEREKVEAEKLAEEKAVAKREANKKHRIKIEKESIAAIHSHCKLDVDQSVTVIAAISKGEIPHIKIIY